MNRPLEGHLILIAEDEPLIALQMTLAFEDEGAFVIMARTLKETLIGVEDHKLSAAILDHALSTADTSTVCERMSERNIPFVIYSDCEPSNGALLGGIHVDKTGGMPELVVVVKRAIVDRPISGPQQIVGMTRAPAASTLRRTLHLF
jgi:CheY-like chemotaxis protein